MRLRHLIDSWNPSKYTVLRELSFPRLCALVTFSAGAAVMAFLLLLLPSLLGSDVVFAELTEKTFVELNASFSQVAPVYLTTNPDIIVTAGEEAGFITITPEGFSVKYFIFFGERTYPWISLSTLESFPIQKAVLAFAIFSLPSALIWGVLLILTNLALFGLLYTFIAYFVLHVREYRIKYSDLWKVTLFAGIPSMTVFAVTPIVRLGLPIAVIIGGMFVVWLVFSMLGSALFAHHEPGKYSARK